MARGKTISIFMMDAIPEGRVKCTYSMWKGMVYKIPRTDIDKCKGFPQLNYSGVYFLFSKVIILVSLCLLLATILNFFTGVINSTMPGSSHVLCAVIFSGVIFWTVAEEKRRINEQK